MMEGRAPAWLKSLERHFGWISIPNIAILILTLQAGGFILMSMDPAWLERLALLPEAALQGEYWRLITFLALPPTLNPLFLIFFLWFLYFIVNSLEAEWGSFRTTLYVLLFVATSIAYSLTFRYPIWRVTHFETSLFLAAATLFPEFEVRLFFAIPVKIKWLAWMALAFLVWELLRGGWLDRFYLLVIYSNYLVFFGPAFLDRIRRSQRRRSFKKSL